MSLRETYEVARLVLDEVGEKNVGLISAGVAFYGLFAIIPALGAIIAIFGMVADPVAVQAELETVRGIVPDQVYALFEDQVVRLLSARSETLGLATLLSVILALWSVRAGVAAVIQGVNALFDRPNRRLAQHYLVAWLMSVSLIGVALVALVVLVVAPIALSFIPFNADDAAALRVLRWFVAFGVMLSGLGIIYRFGPNRRSERLGWITPGALFVVVLWVLVSEAFTFYVTNFGSYSRVYGSLGAVVATLFWFYLSAYLVMLGAALNVVLDRRRPL